MAKINEIPGAPQEWLARAKGNLALAGVEKPDGVFWEDLCFNAQQAAEKAVKAVFQQRGILFRYIHDLEELITNLANHGVEIPEYVKDAAKLTQYALETRYPGHSELTSAEEHRQALQIAERVVAWAEAIIAQSPPSPTTP